MSEPTTQSPQYMVNIVQPKDEGDVLVFTFVPKKASQGNGSEPIRHRAPPQFIVTVPQNPATLSFDWSATPDDPGSAKVQIESEVSLRMHDRSTWIERVNALVDETESWARDLGWSTRRIEKSLDDPRIGKHRLPALLLQYELCRIMLEPIGPSTPGTEGIVDLYLMPAYDDIASLFYYQGRWNLHYRTQGATQADTVREAPAEPLSKEVLERVLADMSQNVK